MSVENADGELIEVVREWVAACCVIESRFEPIISLRDGVWPHSAASHSLVSSRGDFFATDNLRSLHRSLRQEDCPRKMWYDNCPEPLRRFETSNSALISRVQSRHCCLAIEAFGSWRNESLTSSKEAASTWRVAPCAGNCRSVRSCAVGDRSVLTVSKCRFDSLARARWQTGRTKSCPPNGFAESWENSGGLCRHRS